MALDPKDASSLLTPDDVPEGTSRVDEPDVQPSDDGAAVRSSQSPLSPLPAPIVAVWRNFVRDQAGRGKRNVHRMVPVLLELLVERGVQDIKPDTPRKVQLDRQRQALMQEQQRLDRILAALKSEAVPGGYAALDLTALDSAESDPSFAAKPLQTRAELKAYQRDLAGRTETLQNNANAIDGQAQNMARQRLSLAQRLSLHSETLLAVGAEELAAYDAEQKVLEEQRALMRAAEPEPEATTDASVNPAAPTAYTPSHPGAVTYTTLFHTLGRVVRNWLAPILALEPRSWAQARQKAWQALARLLRPR